MALYVVKGLFKKIFGTPKSLIGLESFNKIIKTALGELNVTYEDPCCPTDFAPVRYNKDSGQLEYLSDAEAGTYTQVPVNSLND